MGRRRQQEQRSVWHSTFLHSRQFSPVFRAGRHPDAFGPLGSPAAQALKPFGDPLSMPGAPVVSEHVFTSGVPTPGQEKFHISCSMSSPAINIPCNTKMKWSLKSSSISRKRRHARRQLVLVYCRAGFHMLCLHRAYALDPERTMSQYMREHWGTRARISRRIGDRDHADQGRLPLDWDRQRIDSFRRLEFPCFCSRLAPTTFPSAPFRN